MSYDDRRGRLSHASQTLRDIDARIEKRHLLKHPFYEAWTRGELTLESLQDYASQYYHHVKAFPTYLSALHSRCDDMQVRRNILQNLMDEEAGLPNHPELWLQFAQALGIDQAKVESARPREETLALIKCFRDQCASGDTARGLAALYAYESQIPAVSMSKIDGLKRSYGFDDPAGYEYFTVHIDADVEHSRVERELLGRELEGASAQNSLEGVDQTLDALWALLDGVCVKHGLECAMAQ